MSFNTGEQAIPLQGSIGNIQDFINVSSYPNDINAKHSSSILKPPVNNVPSNLKNSFLSKPSFDLFKNSIFSSKTFEFSSVKIEEKISENSHENIPLKKPEKLFSFYDFTKNNLINTSGAYFSSYFLENVKFSYSTLPKCT